MRRILLTSMAALALAGITPVAAQYAQDRHHAQDSWRYSGRWDSNDFWRGVPSDPLARITFMQRRIDRGVADGSLTRKEARKSQHELDRVRRDARRMGPRLNDRERATLQARLDTVGQNIRWRRADNDYRAGSDTERRFATDYDASRYYRDDPRYGERRLSAQDEVYRGSDGRYYCKRGDGTTGLIIGAAGGGILGNVIDGGGNRVAGTLIGGALGALLGKSIDQNSDIRCR